MQIGEIQISHTNTNVTYRTEPIDSRFEVVGNVLRLRDGRAISAADPLAMQVPVRVIEVLPDGSTGRLFPMSITLNKTSNPRPWQNPVNRLDINRDGRVDPLDVLQTINAFNENTALTIPRPAGTLSQPDVDVDGDNGLSPIDILLIINELNNRSSGGSGGGSGGGGEGEGEADVSVESSPSLQQYALAAVLDEMDDERQVRRRRGL